MQPHIVIVGAGVLGAAIACHLAPHAAVTVLEAAVPGAGASGHGFGWINASFAETDAYFALRRAALDAHRDLEAQLGPLVTWGGAIWWEDAGDSLAAAQARMQARGHLVRRLDRAAFAALEPAIAAPPDASLFTPLEGAVDGARLARACLARAQSDGAVVATGASVSGILTQGGAITGVMTENGPMPADHVVFAAGIGTAHLLENLGLHIPVQAVPGVICRTEPVAALIHHVLMGPGLHLRQDQNGALILGEVFSGTSATPDLITRDPRALAGQMLARLADLLPQTRRGAAPPRLAGLRLGRRPVPRDGLPLLGPLPGFGGATLAVTHSGVTLAPLVGRLLAREILFADESPLLAPFRPHRLMA